jgi:iron complex transport system substrate-binding protein
MKTKTKMIAFVEIVVVLCSVFLVALPALAIAAEEDDYVLDIYGNANEDDTIDMRDLTYVKLIFFGEKSETELADAKYDGKLNPLDFIQIKLIIVGKEKELTIVDCLDRSVTVSMPVERVISVNNGATEILRAVGVDVGEKMVGVNTAILNDPEYWPELQDKPGIAYGSPDYEQIVELNPDIVILYSSPYKDESIEKYEEIGVTVLCLDCFNLRRLDEDVKMLGEIFAEKVKLEEYIKWYHKYNDLIIDRTSSLKVEDKPRVFIYPYPEYYYPALKTVTALGGGHHLLIVNAGGINIAADLSGTWIEVEREWILKQNPDVIIADVAGEYFPRYSADEAKTLEMMKEIRDTLMGDTALSATKAVKEDKVFIISPQLSTAAMYVVGTAYLAKYFHPELFKDIQPEAVLKEYFEEWQGVPYQGVYVYPSP